MTFRYIITFILIFFIASCSNSKVDYDPGPCPRAAILKGSESKEVRSSDGTSLNIELNRTVMICDYNLKRKTVNYDLGIVGDIIGADKARSKTLEFTIFIAFVGPENTIIDKWSKRSSLNLKDQAIVPFSLAIEGLQSNITEGRSGSSYKVLIGFE